MGSSPIRVIGPSKPSARKASAARPPARFAPTMTIPPSGIDSVMVLELRDAFLQRVPREHGALDPDRVLHHALQRDQVAELLLAERFLAAHHLAERERQLLDLLDVLALDL